MADTRHGLVVIARVSPSASRRAEALAALEATTNFLSAFEKVVELKIRRGLTQELGLEGQLRKAVHAVESRINGLKKPELSVIMLNCRRHEKDFLLRGDTKYLQEIEKRIEEFQALTKLSALPEEVQKELAGLWAQYFEAMKVLVQGDGEMKQAMVEFKRLGLAFEGHMDLVVQAVEKDMLGAKADLDGNLSGGRRTMLVVMASGLLLGMLSAAWISSNLGTLTDTIRRVVLSIYSSSAEIAAASQSLASSSAALAEGASEQAASLEETSASLEEMTSMTQRNAENAQLAKDLASQTRAAASQGEETMRDMEQAMDSIKASSQEIAKILRSIDEIAFQTNILALNAAVEAARAGEAGMGFAVVADEVRNLAQRCASAARETAVKIEDAVKRTDRGVRLCAVVSTGLKEIASKAQSVDQLVAEIAAASREQSQGVAQVSTAVTAMDRVPQSNAAGAEESAGSASELNTQADAVRRSLEELQILVGGTGAQTRRLPDSELSSDAVCNRAVRQTPANPDAGGLQSPNRSTCLRQGNEGASPEGAALAANEHPRPPASRDF